MNRPTHILNLVGMALLGAVLTLFVFLAGYSQGLQAAREATSFSPDSSLASNALQRRDRNNTPTAEEAEQFKIFWEAWNLLKRDFYGELPTPQELTYNAIRGVVQELGDPHTGFLPPQEANFFLSDIEGEYEGIGARVGLAEGGGVEIIEPFRGHPAWEAGLRRGDIVIAVDGKDITNLTLTESIALIRGPEGTTVHLTIHRPADGTKFEVDIVRRRIETPIVEGEMLEPNIAYVRLNEFTATSPDQLARQIKTLLNYEPKGLIFDLRGNPGGRLSASVEIGSFFISEGNILIERFSDGREQEYRREGELIVPADLPVVLLVDGGSASAAEIVAGALQDTGRAVLIGETTFGKGSVQLPHTLSDGSLLRVTIARWLTPNGRLIHEQGLTPDIIVPMTPEDQEAGRDPQLNYAIKWIKTNANATYGAKSYRSEP